MGEDRAHAMRAPWRFTGQALAALGAACMLWATPAVANGDLEPGDRAMLRGSDFAASFEPFLDAPSPPHIPPGAVDLSTIDPPLEEAGRDLGLGRASYYGRRFHGRQTANGERFNMRAMTAAHKTLPFGSKVRVTNPRNGRSVVVRINDRGPFIPGRVIDLSRSAAERIGMIQSGHALVELELLN